MKNEDEKYCLRITPEEMMRKNDMAAVTEAEVYAVQVITKELERKQVRAGKDAIIKRTKEILMNHRQEVRDLYRTSPAMLRMWILQESGICDTAAFEKMSSIGLTGNVMHDMKLIEELAAAGKKGERKQ